MFAVHVKGESRRSALDMALEATGRSYTVISSSAPVQEIVDRFKGAKEGSIVVIEDIDVIEPVKMRSICDRLGDML